MKKQLLIIKVNLSIFVPKTFSKTPTPLYLKFLLAHFNQQTQKNIVTHIQHLKAILNNKSVLENAKLLQTKITNNSITHNDFPQINELDELLT